MGLLDGTLVAATSPRLRYARRWSALVLCVQLVTPAALAAGAVTHAALVEQVRASERAFAQSLAQHDLKAFASYVARDAVFANGGETLRGREAVVAGWKAYFAAPSAPFSWSPEQVEVLAGGTLAFSTGPVLNAKGERIGTYKSTWRRERDGRWRVAIDSGCGVCNCNAAPAPAVGSSGAGTAGGERGL